jgi:hypothetical protein
LPNLYIIAGCNGAGKTTASFTILPEMLNCKEFVNADSIAAGLSPFNPESVAIEAARLMLSRIHELMIAGVDFAFETTLATRSYVSLVKEAQQVGYNVTLLFIRRYYRGIFNFINLYMPICDSWISRMAARDARFTLKIRYFHGRFFRAMIRNFPFHCLVKLYQ